MFLDSIHQILAKSDCISPNTTISLWGCNVHWTSQLISQSDFFGSIFLIVKSDQKKQIGRRWHLDRVRINSIWLSPIWFLFSCRSLPFFTAKVWWIWKIGKNCGLRKKLFRRQRNATLWFVPYIFLSPSTSLHLQLSELSQLRDVLAGCLWISCRLEWWLNLHTLVHDWETCCQLQ